MPCFQIPIDYGNSAQIPKTDILDFIKNAQFVGQKFELEIIGCYATQWKIIKNLEVIKQANIDFVMKYHPSLCCKSCSGYSFEQGGKEQNLSITKVIILFPVENEFVMKLTRKRF